MCIRDRFRPSAPAAPAWAAGAFFAFPQGGAQPFASPSLPFFPTVAQGRGRLPKPQTDEKVKACGRMASAQHAASPRGKPDGGYGWYFAVFRIQNCGAKPFCAAGQVGLRAAVKTIFCRLSAARGHFASRNRACLRQGSACPLHAGILLRKTAEPLIFKKPTRPYM